MLIPIDLKSETSATTELAPWHAVMLQLHRQDSQGLASELVQGSALSGLSHRSSSFTLAHTVATAGLYLLNTAVVACSTVLIQYSHRSETTNAMVTAQLPLAVAGRLVDTPLNNVIPPLHWPLNISINVHLIVPNDRTSLILQASFSQPFSLFLNSRQVWQCRSLVCDSGELHLGKYSAGDVLLLQLAIARVSTSSKFSLLWNAANHPIVVEPVLSQHACSSVLHDINGGATRVSVTGATLQPAATTIHWHNSVVSKYCGASVPSDLPPHLSASSDSPDAVRPDASACVPQISSGTLLSFAAFFQDSFENLVAPDFSSLAVFLVSDECDIEVSIASYSIQSAVSVSGAYSSFSIRVIRSTFEQLAHIRLRFATPGLIATYYRDSAAYFTSVASSIDWSSSGQFPGDNSVQIWRAKWKGFLKAPTGAWTLTIAKPPSSTDAVQLQIGRFDVHLGASNSWSNVFSFSYSEYFPFSVLYTHFSGSSSSGLTVSWKPEGVASFAAVPSSAFFSESWSVTSELKVRVSPAASWSCDIISPVLSVATAGLSSKFFVSAADVFGNSATQLSHIKFLLTQLSGCDTLFEKSCLQITQSMSAQGIQVTLTRSGIYQLQIVDSGRNNAPCNGVSQIYVHSGPALLANSIISMLSATFATTGLPLQFEITTRDQFSNLVPLLTSYAYFSFKLTCSGPSPCCNPCVASRSTCASSILCAQTKSAAILEQAGAPTGLGSPNLNVAFIPTQSGFFRLQVLSSRECPYCDKLPAHKFWDVLVKPSLSSAVTLDAAFVKSYIIASDSITVSGRSFDIFGNVVLAPDPPSQVDCVVRLNRRVVSGVTSRVFLVSNFYVSCVVKVTTSGIFDLSMMSFQSQSTSSIMFIYF
jgi:hypothetical protein